MKIVEKIHDMQNLVHQIKTEGKTIGFVPTMGYLHEGHLSLIKRAKAENDVVVLSIFVNPLQFGPNEDYETYPRDIERDQKLAEEIGVDYLFSPTVQEMYPKEPTISIKVIKRTNVLCGRSRVGHFDGVATVVLKLLHIVQPNRAYFGLKDAQQVAVISGLIEDLNIPVELVPVETVREQDGLAKSSRNVHLTPSERNEAKHLYQSLLLGKKLIVQGERNPETIIQEMESYLSKQISGEIDYIEMYSYPDLTPLPYVKGRVIIALAVKFSKARLIDNIILHVD